MKNYYKMLRVDPGAESEIIRAAYRRLCQLYHPDVYKEADAEERMKQINEAYEILNDEQKRAKYDMQFKNSVTTPRRAEPAERKEDRAHKNPGTTSTGRKSTRSPLRDFDTGFYTGSSSDSAAKSNSRLNISLSVGSVILIIIMVAFIINRAGKDYSNIPESYARVTVTSSPGRIHPTLDEENGRAPLHKAVLTKDMELVKKLISEGADVNARDDDEATPLHLAIRSHYWKNVEMAEQLLSGGADPNARDFHGDTPLHLAAGSGQIDMIELLLSKGANINSTSISGSTPLHVAALLQRESAVKLLVASGADVNARDVSGKTPFDVAAKMKKGNDEIYDTLGSGAQK